jgi:hypothetical protein
VADDHLCSWTSPDEFSKVTLELAIHVAARAHSGGVGSDQSAGSTTG